MKEEKNKITLFKGNDGATSSRIVLSFTIIIPLILLIFIVCLHWSFKNHPLPEYVLKIIMRCLSTFIPLIGGLMGFQSLENTNWNKLHNKKKEKNE